MVDARCGTLHLVNESFFRDPIGLEAISSIFCLIFEPREGRDLFVSVSHLSRRRARELVRENRGPRPGRAGARELQRLPPITRFEEVASAPRYHRNRDQRELVEQAFRSRERALSHPPTRALATTAANMPDSSNTRRARNVS